MLEPQLQEILVEEDALSPWRQKAWAKFRDLGSLALKQEAFRYVPVQHLAIPKAALLNAECSFEPSSSYRIVFIDGFFSLERSLLPEGVLCLPLQEAMESYGAFLQNRFAKTLQEETDPFAALNGAFQGLGAFLYIPPELSSEIAIAVEYFFTTREMATPRLIISLGKRSSLSLEQKWHRDAMSFVNAYLDAALDEGAKLTVKTVELQAKESHLFQSCRVSVKKDARFIFRAFSEGAAISRHSISVKLLEVGASALLQGVSTLANNMHHHIHVLVEHLAEHTHSRQHFKTLLRDQSCSSFEGKIYVHKEAQKTESYQLNNVLLLSDLAQCFAKPNLEIFADDVKASHGATIAKLDEESLFYLRSRGLSLVEAQSCLLESFVKELQECLP